MSWSKNNSFFGLALLLAFWLIFWSAFSYLASGFQTHFYFDQVAPDQAAPVGALFLPSAETVIELELAITPEQRVRGLSGREFLPTERGMLFIFPKQDLHGFWMQEMNFSLDIIWLDESFQVVHIEKNLAPESYPQVFKPTKPALFVLELNANQTDIYDIKVDDFLNIAL